MRSNIHIHVHVHPEGFSRIEATLDRLVAKTQQVLDGIRVIQTQEAKQMTDLSALAAEVAQNGDAVGSAVTLLGSLAQSVRDLSTDPAALQALADSLDAQSSELAAAVVANTPADPGGSPEEPPVEPPVEP